MSHMAEVTRILNEISQGTERSEALLPVLYDQLRRQAELLLQNEPNSVSLSATGLVHDVYLRLMKNGDVPKWVNQAHFYAAASEAMRRILVDRARARKAIKRGGELQRQEQNLDLIPCRLNDQELLDLDTVLQQLAVEDAEAAQLVNLHAIMGESLEEAGNRLGMSRASAYRLWAFARAWLRTALSMGDDELST